MDGTEQYIDQIEQKTSSTNRSSFIKKISQSLKTSHSIPFFSPFTDHLTPCYLNWARSIASHPHVASHQDGRRRHATRHHASHASLGGQPPLRLSPAVVPHLHDSPKSLWRERNKRKEKGWREIYLQVINNMLVAGLFLNLLEMLYKF